MGTYRSQPYQGSEFVSGIPIDLIAKVGMMKQLKYEQTVQGIQNQLDEVGNYDIIKDSEKQYVNDRLKQTVDKLNSFSGVDLNDSTVANQLRSATSSLSRDPRLYAAVADTRAIRNNIAQLNEIKEKRPEEYASQNEAEFMQGINDYLNAPEGKRYSGQTYTPYYNVTESYGKVAKAVADNPDIQREILWVQGPDGKPIRRGDREVKQVTREKIQQALINSGDQRAIKQMQIDYRATMVNKTTQGAVEELRNQREFWLSQSKEAKDIISKGIADPQTLQMAQELVQKVEGDGKDNAGILKQLDGKITEVRATGDPSKYYSFDKYAKDITDGIASSYAYQQKGKIDNDDIFMEGLKFDYQSKLEQVKSAYKLQEEKMKAGKGGIDPNFTDSFTNSFLNIEDNPNRESNIDDAGMYSLFDAFKNTDGTGTITLGNGNTFLDIGKALEANGVQETNSNKVRGLATLNSAYSKWSKDNTKTVREQGSQLGGGSNLGVGSVGRNRTIVPTIEEFLRTDQGKTLSAQVKEQTGLDLANANDRKNIETFAASPDAQDMAQYTDALTKLRGQVRIRPMNGMNLFAGNDNQYYGKMQGLFTQKELEDSGLGSSGFKKLLSKGILEATLNQTEAKGKRDPEMLYALPITRKVEKDIPAAYTNYMTTLNSGDNFYMKAIAGHQELFRDRFTSMSTTRGLKAEDLKVQGQSTLDKLATTAKSSEDVHYLESIKAEYNKQVQILNSSASSLDKLKAKKFLSNLITNSQNISTLETPSIERKPGQTIGEAANNPGNLKHVPNDPIVKMFGGVDSGLAATDGGTFTRFPDQLTGFKAFQARIFGPTDGLYSSNYYQPTKKVDEALKSYSGYKIKNGKAEGYNGDIYPEIKNKQLKDLTAQERDELSSRMLKIENGTVYNQLVNSGVIKKV